MTRGTATTESPSRWRRRTPAQFSVRTRITVGIALLTAIAMASAGLLVYALESARIERSTSEEVEQEIAEFNQLQDGTDPDTGQPFDDVGRLLDLFLARNVTDDDEMLVRYNDSGPVRRTPNRYGERIITEPAYLRTVAGLLGPGGASGTEIFHAEPYGEVWVTAVPVSNNDSSGALVIVNFLDDEHEELNRTMRTYAIVALLSLGVIVVLAAFQSGRLLAPLRTLREAASDISTTDLSRRIPERGNDDITALTHTINGMLERLEQGFEMQRRFLDDAGHELKTPLTVVRGHLELIDGSDPRDVAQTRALLLDEVDRMSRLVGDLMLLAKARRPDFLTPGPVGLARLTHTLLDKARALGDREWRLDAVADVTVPVDEQRITQAVLQLADNAVKHTDVGDEIAIGSSFDATTVTLWVQDTGDGVPAADRLRIFERFGRSQVRAGDEGFGLGLSIVRAIAEAHGGTVVVSADHGPGARFEISLPRKEPTAWPAS